MYSLIAKFFSGASTRCVQHRTSVFSFICAEPCYFNRHRLGEPRNWPSTNGDTNQLTVVIYQTNAKSMALNGFVMTMMFADKRVCFF